MVRKEVVYRGSLSAIVFLVLVSCSGRQEEQHGDFVLPGEIQGLALVERQTGEQAARLIGRLHGRNVAPEGSVIGTFGPPSQQIVVYVSRFATVKEAEDQIASMAKAIGSGSSGFTRPEMSTIRSTPVHSVVGHGQMHYYFSQDDQVIWLSAPLGIAPGAVAELLGVGDRTKQ